MSWRVATALRSVVLALAACALAFAPAPNAVVSGSRPSPYGFCIPSADYQELVRHHSVAVWLTRPLSSKEFCAQHWFAAERLAELRAFQREFGVELSADPEADLPAGVPIWLPPDERTADTCCVWIWSGRDGWVSAQSDGVGLRNVPPTYAHAAADSGSIDVSVFPVPVALQREWQAIAQRYPPGGGAAALQGLSPALRKVIVEWNAAMRPPARHFSFSQWVKERSNVARTIVALPIAAVDGQLQFREPPSVHWLDAFGNATSPDEPPGSSMVLVLVAVCGGALLGFAVFAARRRPGPAA